MPADATLNGAPTARHGNAVLPYPCHARTTPPGGQGFIDHGYCRTSLDSLVGSTDPRCPADCKHKAPASLVARFEKRFMWHGAQAAAAWAKKQKEVT